MTRLKVRFTALIYTCVISLQLITSYWSSPSLSDQEEVTSEGRSHSGNWGGQVRLSNLIEGVAGWFMCFTSNPVVTGVIPSVETPLYDPF